MNMKDYIGTSKFAKKTNMDYTGKYLMAFIIISLITFFRNYKIIVWIIKISFCIFEGIRWLIFMKEENKVKYFKPSLICTGANWLIIIVLLFQQIKITAYVFSFIPIYIIIGMILMLKGGNDYLKVINKYYPAVMREYNNSEDSIDIKLENLEKKLLELKESSPAIVVDAIMKRETIKLIWPFHIEMVFLVIMIFWGTNYT